MSWWAHGPSPVVTPRARAAGFNVATRRTAEPPCRLSHGGKRSEYLSAALFGGLEDRDALHVICHDILVQMIKGSPGQTCFHGASGGPCVIHASARRCGRRTQRRRPPTTRPTPPPPAAQITPGGDRRMTARTSCFHATLRTVRAWQRPSLDGSCPLQHVCRFECRVLGRARWTGQPKGRAGIRRRQAAATRRSCPTAMGRLAACLQRPRFGRPLHGPGGWACR